MSNLYIGLVRFAHPNNQKKRISSFWIPKSSWVTFILLLTHIRIKSYDKGRIKTKRIIECFDCGKSHESWTSTVNYSFNLSWSYCLLPGSLIQCIIFIFPFVLIYFSPNNIVLTIFSLRSFGMTFYLSTDLCYGSSF